MLNSRITALVAVVLGSLSPGVSSAKEKLRVVTTLPEYAWATRAIAGDLVDASSICPPDQDPHFLTPRPSYAVRVGQANAFVDTGLDLELWAPVLLQKSGNRAVAPGSPGYISAAEGVPLLDKPVSADRSQGDVHVFGNPHVHTSPVNMRIIIRNIARGLARIDPDNKSQYEKGAKREVRKLDEQIFGRELVDIIGGETLARLSLKGKLFSFLQSRKFRGRPLEGLLGGWLGAARSMRGRSIVTYHNNWTYWAQFLDLTIETTVELKPGVAPSARHVRNVLEIVKAKNVQLIMGASHYPRDALRGVAARSGIRAEVVPFHLGGKGTTTYPALVERWLRALTGASTPAKTSAESPR
jgi:ABC-type Zn uptake system ZnuABC Zn-binding protein ZnuA